MLQIWSFRAWVGPISLGGVEGTVRDSSDLGECGSIGVGTQQLVHQRPANNAGCTEDDSVIWWHFQWLMISENPGGRLLLERDL
jgi:hypothetical protein